MKKKINNLQEFYENILYLTLKKIGRKNIKKKKL